MTVAGILAERIGRSGPRPVREVVELALYHRPGGFYETGGAAGGRDGDFVTSPEVGALFGAVVARALDGWWEQLGRPDPYVVVEAGAGPGSLARSVLAGEPACAPALRYVLVERSAAQRARHGERLRLEEPALVLPPVDPDSGEAVPGAPRGPICASLAELPRVPGAPVVVLANELLDNVPCDLAERRERAWHEVLVGSADPPATPEDGAGAPAFEEILVPLDEARAAVLDRLAPDAPDRARVPLQDGAGEWLRQALSTAGPSGRVVVVDYGAETAELARRPFPTWMRTYRRHGRGAGYLDDLGSQDVTCEVAVDQLAAVKPPERVTTQRRWLEAWGVGDLVGAAERVWADRAHLGDLQAMAARSRTNEARGLLDPQGLGAFRVLEWTGW